MEKPAKKKKKRKEKFQKYSLLQEFIRECVQKPGISVMISFDKVPLHGMLTLPQTLVFLTMLII